MTDFPTVPGYRLLSLLGEGGMGRVYLAEDLVLGRRTAIKFVSERMSADPDSRARFLREARTMATVEHANVVRVYSFGEAAGSAYLVMEYVAGESLSERLRRVGRLDPTEAIKITDHVAKALDAAWENKLVHRDIKPSNIMLDQKGLVRVADFGLAKPLSVTGDDASLTHTGEILGTPHYVSPEQARGHPADIRSDMYSLGIVLYEMLTGERPFTGKTPFDVVAKHIHEPLPPILGRRADLPPDIAALVGWMTEKDPNRRPPSYQALRDRIRSLRDPGAKTPARTSTLGALAAPYRPPGRAPIALLAALFLVGAALGYRGLQYRLPPPPAVESNLVVVVTPFSGPDEDSARAGKVMAGLIESAIGARFSPSDVRAIGAAESGGSVKDHAAARALGEKLKADAVIWGDAFSLRGETEIRPYLTLVPRPERWKRWGFVPDTSLDPSATLAERSGDPLVLNSNAPSQLELAKTGAAGVSDLVLILAGSHALKQGHAERALAFFSQAPPTVESLHRRADALLMLGRTEDAREALAEAVTRDPGDAQSQASLADVLLTTGRVQEAIAAYARAEATGNSYRTREAILRGGKLYQRETFPYRYGASVRRRDSMYMLGIEPKTGRVLERHLVPGPVTGLSPKGLGIEVTFRLLYSDGEATIEFADGAFREPVFVPLPYYAGAAASLASNFVRPDSWDLPVTGGDKLFPTTFEKLDEELRRARAKDPTQPWYLFLMGQSEWAQGRKDAAEARWKEMFAQSFPAIPSLDYITMAATYERFGQFDWADRAFEYSRQRKAQRRLRTPSDLLYPLWTSARAIEAGADPMRGYLWLTRLRETSEIKQGHEVVAAVWAHYFRQRGDHSRAAKEEEVWRDLTADPLIRYTAPARLDATVALFLGLSIAAWLAVLALCGTGRRRALARRGAKPPWRAILSEVTTRERQTAVLACGLAIGAFGLLAAQTQRTYWLSKVPVGADDLGSRPSLEWVEEVAAKSRNRLAASFVAGVAHQRAGRFEQADSYYRRIQEDRRAELNLAAVKQRDLRPPTDATMADIAEAAIGTATLADTLLLKELPRYGRWSNLRPVLRVTAGLMVVLSFALALGLLTTSSLNRDDGLAAAPSIWRTVIPGLADLSSGAPIRGQMAISLAFTSAVAICASAYASQVQPALGMLSLHSRLRLAYAPLPDRSFWTEFLGQTEAAAYCACVLGAGIIALGLHAYGLHRLRARLAVESDETISRAAVPSRVEETLDATGDKRDGTRG